MIWVGLTGGIGCGKSTVTGLLREMGIPVADADEIARKVVDVHTNGLRSIVSEFGQEILNQQRALDRKKLAEIVFKSPERLKTLENIVHPLIREEVSNRKKRWQREGHALGFYDVPLLFERQLEKDFDFLLVVTCSLEIQKERLRVRDQLTEEQIQDRLAAQMPLKEKEKRAHFVLKNNGTTKELEEQLKEIIPHIYEAGAKKNPHKI